MRDGKSFPTEIVDDNFLQTFKLIPDVDQCFCRLVYAWVEHRT